jgi:hypothetical protein
MRGRRMEMLAAAMVALAASPQRGMVLPPAGVSSWYPKLPKPRYADTQWRAHEHNGERARRRRAIERRDATRLARSRNRAVAMGRTK